MEISIYHKAFKVILSPMARILFVAGVLLSACTDSEQAPPPVPEHTATLRLVFKQQGSATESSSTQLKGADSFATDAPLTMDAGTTRAPMTRAVNETDIQTVDVLSFKADASEPNDIKKGTFFYRSKGVYTQLAPGQGRVQVKLIGSPDAQTLVVLANARTQVDALGATYGEQKETVMNRLTFDVAAEASPDFTNGIPMWGELPNEVVGEGFSPSGAPKEVTMIRSVAKFTLVNPPQSDPKGFFFYYDQLRLYNYRSKGRIAPDNYNGTDNKVSTPTVPAGARLPRGAFVQLNSEVSPGRIDIYEGKQKSFYLCEVDNNVRPSGGNALDDLCLIVYVKSYGISFPTKPQEHGYYRLDFKDYGTEARMDILRNHDYKIQVESVEGLPADTPEEAFNGNHTLKCRIVPWNDVQEEVKVPGNKRLTVDKRSIHLKGASAVTTGETLTVTTENTGGWTITNVPSWLTVSPTTSATDGTKSITVKSTGTDILNTGSFKLKAGNAEMAIHVKLGKNPLEYVAEFNLAGGAQYGVRPQNAPVTAAQTDAQLRWAINHNIDQSGYYTWYVLKGVPDFYCNPSRRNLFNDIFFTAGHPGHGYHLPSRWELVGIFSHEFNTKFRESINTPDINEACEVGGVKRTFASQYYSTGNGTCYALRLKQATGNPTDGSPTTGTGPNVFPLTTNNGSRCAYRYRIVGTNGIDNTLNRLEIDCVHVGDDPSITIGDISRDTWWAARTAETVTRVFPATGNTSLITSLSQFLLNNFRLGSSYWSSTNWNDYNAYHGAFSADHSGVGRQGKTYGYCVRLFADE
ncbi:hypothetical protein M1B74_13540 [Bacteroides pyogenes]|uniref:hypothetical protein n=1 Tax=Bacteroides pyogenes TaxID=310300 RepID=UPI003B43519A